MKSKELVYIKAVTAICFSFGVLGIVLALLARSSSMLFDGMYSFIQSMFILLSGAVVRLIGREDDERFHFGYSAFEPFYIMLRTLSLIIMDTVLLINAVKAIAKGGYEVEASIVLAFTAFSVVVCAIVCAVLYRKADEMGSPTLRTEARSWLNDTLLSVAVLVSFMIMAILKKCGVTAAAMYIDPAVTLLFAVFLLPGVVKQMLHAIGDLLDAAPAAEDQERLERIVSEFGKEHGFRDWNIYSARHGRVISSMIYIIPEKDMTVSEADVLRKALLKRIHTAWSWSDTDIVFSMDSSSWMKYAVPAAPKEDAAAAIS